MRLFVAIHPDAATEAWLAAEQRRVRHALGAPERDLRWVDPASIHVTLAFLGELPEAAPVAEALAPCRFDPIELSVGGLGFFPNARRPNVLWTGVKDPSGALARLQAAIVQALTPLVEPEHRRFEPHLTLARVRPHARLGSKAAKLAEEWTGTPQPWRVDRFALMQSLIDEGGARHRVLRAFHAQPG